MKYETLKRVSAAEFKATLEAFVAECGTQQKAANKIGVSQGKLHQAISQGNVGRKVPAYFGLRLERVLVRAEQSQGK